MLPAQTREATMAESHIGFAALLLSGLILAACQTGPGVNVPEGAASGDLELRATGSGNWGVACSGISTRGREAQADIKGRGNATDVIVLNDLTSATCDFSAGDAASLTTLGLQAKRCISLRRASFLLKLIHRLPT